MSLTCGDVDYICQRCRPLPTSCTIWLTWQGRPVARCAPVPATLPGDPDRGAAHRDRAFLSRAPWRGNDGPATGDPGRAAEGWYVVSTAEPGTEPVTFRAMFIQELRARREQTGLLQREFAEKAHVSLSSVKQYEAGRKKPGRKFAIWCDDFYGCPGTFERLYDGMIAESHPSWFGPRVLLEDKAACVDEWEIRGIPGLLQTRSYASAVIRACRPYDIEEELEREAAARIERQNILARDDPRDSGWSWVKECSGRRSGAPA